MDVHIFCAKCDKELKKVNAWPISKGFCHSVLPCECSNSTYDDIVSCWTLENSKQSALRRIKIQLRSQWPELAELLDDLCLGLVHENKEV